MSTPAETARGLRQLAKYIERPDEARQADAPPALEPEAVELAGSLITVFLDGPAALQRARDFGGRGYAGGGGGEGSGKGGHTSPTETAALSDRADDFTQAGHTILAKTTEATAALNVAARTIRQLLATAPPVSDVEGARCKVPECTDLAVKDGFCSTDYQYVRRTGTMPTAEVLRARRAERRLAGSTT